MAFMTIPSSLIQIGRAIRKELWQYVKDDLDDLDTRQTALEAATQRSAEINELITNLGQYAGGSSLERLVLNRAKNDFNFISFEVTQIFAGTAGTLEFDLKVGNSPNTLSSIMTVKPSMSFSDGNYFVSNNQVFATTLVTEGQYYQLDCTQIQTGQGSVQVTILGEPA